MFAGNTDINTTTRPNPKGPGALLIAAVFAGVVFAGYKLFGKKPTQTTTEKTDDWGVPLGRFVQKGYYEDDKVSAEHRVYHGNHDGKYEGMFFNMWKTRPGSPRTGQGQGGPYASAQIAQEQAVEAIGRL